MRVLVDQLAKDETTAVYRALNPDHAVWTFSVQLLAEILNTARVGNWMQSADAASKQPKHRPEPVQPPWATPVPAAGAKRYGTGRMSVEQATKWLGWDNRTPDGTTIQQHQS